MTTDDLENIVNQDPVTYEKFYKDYFIKLFNYGRKFTVDTTHIEDSIQEVFMDLWVNKNKLTKVNSINSYLFSSFRYTLLRRLRNENKTVSNNHFESEPEFSVEYAIINREDKVELQAKLDLALKALTPRQREAIFLRFYQNLSYEETAEILNISTKATYKIMARSLAALKESMPDSFTLLMVYAQIINHVC